MEAIVILSFYDPIPYTAKTIDNNTEILLTNIFKNYTGIFKKVAKKYNLITYYIKGSPRPESLSNELYGNPQFYWALLMANDVYDPLHGWIKSQESVYESLVQEKGNPDDQVAYHIDNQRQKYYNLIQYVDRPGIWYDKSDELRMYPQYFGELAAISLYEEAILENEKKREIKIIPPSDIDNFLSDLIREMENLDASTV